MTTLQFDPGTHTYTADGARLPSVTEVLRDVLQTPQYGQQWHLDRGTANHALYAMLADGIDPMNFVLDLRARPYMEGWLAWADAWNPQDMHPEKTVWHLVMRYAGTADLLCRIKGRLTIVDFKQSAGPLDVIQMAGYALAYESADRPGKPWVDQAASCQIDGSGGYKFELVRGSGWARARNEWRSIMAVHRIKERVNGR